MRAPANFQSERRFGEDKIGKFHLTGGPCTNCQATNVVCVHYRFNSTLEFPGNFHAGDTILTADPGSTYLGINCGCYAKFHRQVAHIQEAQRRK